jgi:Tfp pilus assembly protein PilZ
MSEKRGNKRSPVELAASFGVDAQALPSYEATVKNISQGGFCFQTKNQLRPDQILNLCVETDDKGRIQIDVKVVWVQSNVAKGESMVGVQLVNQNDEQHKRLLEITDQDSEEKKC